jgi:hypothetical protein
MQVIDRLVTAIRPAWRQILLLAAGALAVPAAVAGQEGGSGQAGSAAGPRWQPATVLEPVVVPRLQQLPAAGGAAGEDSPLSPVFLASAILPGSAQYLMGNDRWVPYAAVELWALISYVQQRRLGRSLEQRYRDVAWQVARRVSVGERRDTVFEYYEAMTQYGSSGGWMPGGVPERQDGTFNGELWKLAQALYLPAGQPAPPGSPAYEAAVQYYLNRAIPPGYAWAWGGNNLEQQVFADLIIESDAAFRSATRYAGIVVANHVVSAVEAFITSRLRQLSGDALRLETGPVRYGGAGGWEYGVRVRF